MGDGYSEEIKGFRIESENYKVLADGTRYDRINWRYSIYAYNGRFYLYDKEHENGRFFAAIKEFDARQLFREILEEMCDESE